MTAKTARLLPAALIVGVALCSAACLEKETRSTAYVEEDGAVTWVIVETGVRSDKPDAAEAGREEGEYLSGYQSFTAPVPLALAAMGGRNLRSEVLRDRVPLATLASARFDGLEDLARSFCSAAAWSCSTRTQRDGALTTWTWTVLPTADAHERTPADALSDALGTLRIVFAAGRPVSANGFKLEGHSATVDLPDDDEGEEFTFSLTWEGARK